MDFQELKIAKKLISAMPINELMESKEIYGSNCNNISSHTIFGSGFKAEYDKGSFQNLK